MLACKMRIEADRARARRSFTRVDRLPYRRERNEPLEREISEKSSPPREEWRRENGFERKTYRRITSLDRVPVPISPTCSPTSCRPRRNCETVHLLYRLHRRSFRSTAVTTAEDSVDDPKLGNSTIDVKFIEREYGKVSWIMGRYLLARSALSELE